MAKTRLVAKLKLTKNVFLKSTEQNTLLKEEGIIYLIRNGPRVLFCRNRGALMKLSHAKGYQAISAIGSRLNGGD